MIYKEKEITSKEEYLELFKAHSKKTTSELIKNALERAHDTRKFEIELYWKRATFFWTFIAAAFIALFAILNNSDQDVNFKYDIALLVAIFGIVLSISFLLVNKGSKYWQENWEKHIDFLEDEITGPLYKTTIVYKPTILSVIDPKVSFKYSISKVAQIVSFYIFVFWVLISIRILSERYSMIEPFNGFNLFVIAIYLISFLSFIISINIKKEMETRNFNFISRELEGEDKSSQKVENV